MTATVCERDVLAAADTLAGDLERRCVVFRPAGKPAGDHREPGFPVP